MEWVFAALWAVSVGLTATITASVCYRRSGKRETMARAELSQSKLDNDRTVKYLGEITGERDHLRAELEQAALNAKVLEETKTEYASGGVVNPIGTSLVGETGQLHYSIDARGARDPDEVRMKVEKAIRLALARKPSNAKVVRPAKKK